MARCCANLGNANRFARHRLEGLSDNPRPGKPKAYDEETERRILRLLDTDAPSGYSQWNGRLLAKAWRT